MRFKNDKLAFGIIGYSFVSVMAFLCTLPFLLIISGSLTDQKSVYKYGYRLIPKVFSLEAYEVIFKAPEKIVNAYIVTIFVTVVGTAIGLLFTAMASYALINKEFKHRNKIAFYFYFTQLFNGGLAPFYLLVVKTLGFKDSILGLLFPGLISVWNIIVMRSFFKTLPEAIFDSAKVDGSGYFRTFTTIVLPISKPVLATIGLFIALFYWNDWFAPMLFIEREALYPLQYFLYRVLNAGKAAEAAVRGAKIPAIKIPTETIKLAITIVTIGPIVLLYPFVQKYFVKGLTIGAVKG